MGQWGETAASCSYDCVITTPPLKKEDDRCIHNSEESKSYVYGLLVCECVGGACVCLQDEEHRQHWCKWSIMEDALSGILSNSWNVTLRWDKTEAGNWKERPSGRALSWLVHGTRACETWASDQIQEVQPKYYHLDGSLSQEQKQFRVASSLVVMLLFFFSALRW